MNIFKILGNGDGKINEPNVSAFLGYLLNPKADHGLGYEFIKRFLNSSVDNNFYIETYEYEIFFEQAFKKKNEGKEIIDIVIICYKIPVGEKKENLVNQFVTKTKEIDKIFIIENKINTNSKKEGQIEKQYNNTIKELPKDNLNKIHSIYLTPNVKEYKEEFKNTKIPNSTHLFWDNDPEAISSILSDIFEDEANGKIEPIQEYTLHTLKAFYQFILNNFIELGF